MSLRALLSMVPSDRALMCLAWRQVDVTVVLCGRCWILIPVSLLLMAVDMAAAATGGVQCVS